MPQQSFVYYVGPSMVIIWCRTELSSARPALIPEKTEWMDCTHDAIVARSFVWASHAPPPPSESQSRAATSGVNFSATIWSNWSTALAGGQGCRACVAGRYRITD